MSYHINLHTRWQQSWETRKMPRTGDSSQTISHLINKDKLPSSAIYNTHCDSCPHISRYKNLVTFSALSPECQIKMYKQTCNGQIKCWHIYSSNISSYQVESQQRFTLMEFYLGKKYSIQTETQKVSISNKYISTTISFISKSHSWKPFLLRLVRN